MSSIRFVQKDYHSHQIGETCRVIRQRGGACALSRGKDGRGCDLEIFRMVSIQNPRDQFVRWDLIQV